MSANCLPKHDSAREYHICACDALCATPWLPLKYRLPRLSMASQLPWSADFSYSIKAFLPDSDSSKLSCPFSHHEPMRRTVPTGQDSYVFTVPDAAKLAIGVAVVLVLTEVGVAV